MLRIGKLTDYAIVILSYLAEDIAAVLSATRIAKDIRLSVPTVSKLLKILQEAGLVKSFRGTVGGYQLARLAEEITLADVVIAIEGDFGLTDCCSSQKICALDTGCGTKENWQIINRVILKALKQVTLHDMTHSLREHPLSLQGIPIRVEG